MSKRRWSAGDECGACALFPLEVKPLLDLHNLMEDVCGPDDVSCHVNSNLKLSTSFPCMQGTWRTSIS